MHGLPTATTLGGIDLVTTLPAPITELSPIVTPGRTTTFPPNHTLLPTVIGQVIYDKLEAHLKSPEESADTMENLRKQCLGFVILSAVKRLMAETGSITDRGLYFSELTDKEGNETLKPVADELWHKSHPGEPV